MGYLWFIYGSSLIYGLSLVYLWFISGIIMVFLWFIYGFIMVYLWLICGYLWLSMVQWSTCALQPSPDLMCPHKVPLQLPWTERCSKTSKGKRQETTLRNNLLKPHKLLRNPS